MFERIKEWVKEHPAWTGIILGLLAVFIYAIFSRRKKPQGEEGIGAFVYQPPVDTGGGGVPGGAGFSLPGIGEQIKAMQQAQQEQMRAIQQAQQEWMRAQNEALMQNIAAMRQTQEAQIKALQEASQAMMQQAIAQAKAFMEQQLSAALQLPTTIKLMQGPYPYTASYKGITVSAENPYQIKEVLSGGSRNVGGSYTIDFSKWSPVPGVSREELGQVTMQKVSAVAGRQITSFDDPAFKSLPASEKLEILRKAGVIS